MKSSRFLSALVVPVVALSLVACSSEEEAPKETSTPVVTETQATEGDGETSAPEETEDGQEQTPEAVAETFNEFYVKLADESLYTEYESTMQEAYPDMNVDVEEEAQQLSAETATEIYGDLVSYIDTEGLSQDEVDELHLHMMTSNMMYSVFSGDMIPEPNLSPESVTVDGDTATFDSTQAFDFGDLGEGVETTENLVTMVYKDGRWLFTPDFMDMSGSADVTMEEEFTFEEEFQG